MQFWLVLFHLLETSSPISWIISIFIGIGPNEMSLSVRVCSVCFAAFAALAMVRAKLLQRMNNLLCKSNAVLYTIPLLTRRKLLSLTATTLLFLTQRAGSIKTVTKMAGEHRQPTVLALNCIHGEDTCGGRSCLDGRISTLPYYALRQRTGPPCPFQCATMGPLLRPELCLFD